MNEKIKNISKEIKSEVIDIRRHLHMYPELGYEEYETAELIKQKLDKYGIAFKSGIAETGVLGIVEGAHDGGVVALRADMDALPIQEDSNHPYKSTKRKIMHACGHDAHTAMLLGAARILQQLRKHLHGTVLLVFQPAEEKSPIGGAKPMLEAGVFSEYRPDVIYAQHVWPQLPAGQFGIRDEEMMGASDKFKVTLKGTGGHASMPHLSNDPVVTAAHLITSLQTIVSRATDPLKTAVVTISKIKGGSAHNIITDRVELEGTVRTFDQDLREYVKKRFFEMTKHVAYMFSNEAEIEYVDGYPATVNTLKWAQLARRSVKDLFGEDATPDVSPSMASEDFSRFLEEIPGAFIWLGTCLEEQEKQKGLHDSSFDINEASLEYGTALLAKIAYDTLEELKKKSG